tara:strand:- start:946 stop:2046 length:1101 start_codon:yes stop_codon:yes gene_type:complete
MSKNPIGEYKHIHCISETVKTFEKTLYTFSQENDTFVVSPTTSSQTTDSTQQQDTNTQTTAATRQQDILTLNVNSFIRFCLSKLNKLNDDVCYYMYYILTNLNISEVKAYTSHRTANTTNVSDQNAELMLNNIKIIHTNFVETVKKIQKARELYVSKCGASIQKEKNKKSKNKKIYSLVNNKNCIKSVLFSNIVFDVNIKNNDGEVLIIQNNQLLSMIKLNDPENIIKNLHTYDYTIDEKKDIVCNKAEELWKIIKVKYLENNNVTEINVKDTIEINQTLLMDHLNIYRMLSEPSLTEKNIEDAISNHNNTYYGSIKTIVTNYTSEVIHYVKYLLTEYIVEKFYTISSCDFDNCSNAEERYRHLYF